VYQTVLTGAGSSNVCTDVFTIPLKTDVVFIIDNSVSMADKQSGLGDNGNALFAGERWRRLQPRRDHHRLF
jgi:hypothetical protein